MEPAPPSRRLAELLERRPGALAAAALALQALALFPALLLRGRALFNRDLQLFCYTQLEDFVRIVTSPAWPLWDPWNAFGQPLVVDPSAQLFYPTTWLNLLVRPWVFYTLYVAVHFWGSGLGLFRLARAQGLAAPGALVAALLWTGSGPLLSLANNPQHFAGACWLPWVLLAAERAARAPGRRSAALWGLALAGQILGGSADMCALGLLACGVLLARHADWRSWTRTRPLAGTALGACLLGLAAAGVAWLPAAEAVLASARRSLPEAMRTYWSVHPASLLEFAFPLGSRNLHLGAGLQALLYEGREPFLVTLYLGLPALALALCALGAADRRLRGSLGALLGLAALLALGRHFPLLRLVYALFPPAQIFRYPVKATVLAALAVALLAGLGLDTWRAPRDAGGGRRAVAALLAVAVALALAGWLGLTLAPARIAGLVTGSLPSQDVARAALAEAAGDLGLTLALAAGALAAVLAAGQRARAATWLAVLAVADLCLQHRDLHPSASADLFAHRPAVLERIPAGREARLYAYDYQYLPSFTQRHLGRTSAYFPRAVPPGWTFREAEALAKREALVPPIAATWGRETAFDLDYRGLYSRELNRLVLLLRQVEGTPAHRRLLQLGGVTHVVALHTDGLEDLEPDGTFPGFALDPVRVFKVADALPRAYAVGGARVLDEEAALQALLAADFDPRREVVLADGAAASPPADFASSCRVTSARPDELRLEVDLSAAGWAVVLETFAPGWNATVDGRTVAVQRANVAFRAVAVPAGRHEVRLLYRPRSVIVGLALSFFGLGATLACGLLRRTVGQPVRTPEQARPS